MKAGGGLTREAWMKIGGRLKSEIFVDVVGRKVLRAAAAAVRSCEGGFYAFDLKRGRRVKGLAHKDLPGADRGGRRRLGSIPGVQTLSEAQMRRF